MIDLMAELEGQFPPGFTVYRVQDCWRARRARRGVVVRRPRHWWMRTWQAEWTGAPRAYRSFTRNGAIVKAVRAHSQRAPSGAYTAAQPRDIGPEVTP